MIENNERDGYGPGSENVTGASSEQTRAADEAGNGKPPEVERPQRAVTSADFSAEPNRDPSLSRAVDRATAGLRPEDAGYDRSMEGPPPGPLDPDADSEPAESEGPGGGAWGSSG